MTSLENLLFTLSGRVNHAFDFTFHKNNGDFANYARSELRSIATSPLPLAVRDIRIDEDGDVEIQTNKSRFYLTPTGVVVGGWLTKINDLSESIQALSRVVDLLVAIRAPLKPETYGVRLGFIFTPVSGLRLIRTSGIDAVLNTVLAQKAPTDIEKFKYSTRYKRGDFSDTLELEGSEKEVQLRYFRDCFGKSFESFGQFLTTADLAGIYEELRGFAERLVADERPSGWKRAAVRQADHK